ncbi:MAG: hypothetical protein Q4B88_04625 [Moraxella sp.]|nr:hypothetical protein [Moraxella sp.]
MTYLAPRQGRFAIVLLVSFCLTVLFFVMSVQGGQSASDKAAAEQLAGRLADEISVPLAMNDRVSLAVIAERFLSDPRLSYVGIYDEKGTLIVPVGDDIDAAAITTDVTDGETHFGQVAVKTLPISRAGVILQYWLFLLAVLFLHALVWLIYAYVARPTAALKASIAYEVREKLLAQKLISPEQAQTITQSLNTLPEDDFTAEAETADAKPEKKMVTVGAFLKDKLGAKKDNKAKNALTDEIAVETDAKADTIKAPLATSEQAERLKVTVRFVDRHGLLEVLMRDRGAAYFALCDQLLQKTLDTLLDDPVLTGVGVASLSPFDESGAVIILERHAPSAKLSLAAAMLTKLLVLINQVVYEKHRELAYFALPMKAIASDEMRALAADKLLMKYSHKNLLLVGAKDAGEVASFMNLKALPEPNGIYERECRILTAVSDGMAEKLLGMRRKVLLGEFEA